MHAWHIDEVEYVRHEERRGRRHAFTALDPGRTALVVVDLVPFFVADNPYCRAVLPQVDRLAGALRAEGGTVAWVVPGRETPRPVDVERLGPEVAARYASAGGEGPPRARLWPGLDVRDDDPVVDKFAPSAFFPGRSDLPALLDERGIDTVVVAGTLTNVCCESSARDACTLGYRVVLVADACAARDDAIHNATLRTVYRSFGDVRSTDEVVGLVSSAAAPARS